MNERDVKVMVDDFPLWRGNAYTLAIEVFKRQKEAVADMLEAAGLVEAAELVRQG